MRVKIESVAPLPHVKAWFSAHALPTIYDLKTALCTDLNPLKDASIEAQDLLLLLDDFELLDASPIDVVHDGDLIVIKKTSGTLTNLHKRKASTQDALSPTRKRAKTEDGKRAQPKALNGTTTANRAHTKQRAPSPSSSSGSSSESDSESESSSSDSESSDSDSSDSSSDSSSSSSAPSATTTRRKTKLPLPKAKPTSSAPPVPPGLGKSSTHSRNIRRRRKKMYERLTMTVEPASVNDIPLGSRATTLEPRTLSQIDVSTHAPAALESQKGKGEEKAQDENNLPEPPLFMMASLQNKNKRRGFKDALTRGVPAKITFPESHVASSSAQPDADVDAVMVEATLRVEETPRRQQQQPRLIPPSEKQELGQLPPNVFVTSVDVEEGKWSARRKNKKKKKAAQADETWDQREEEAYPDALPYDDVPVAAVTSTTQATAAADVAEHAVVAAQWDTLRKITEKAQVAVGATVAWKALGINFATLTPEMLLHLGRIVQCGEQLVVAPIADAGATEVSFGGPVVDEEGGPVEETFEWADVLQGDWRLVSAR
ncbi:hypothetical protein C8Q80DRAFT_1268869 [Daedaleopsis nitida]|nr:hypothetical protein C8Q80DRAFT_1268869 [Daedaleopsis nitida]